MISAAAAKSLQSFPTVCDHIDSSPLGSAVHGILQARTLEWVVIFLLQCIKVKSESEVVQSCQTLSDPVDCNLPCSSIHGIFQARVLEWGAISLVQLCATLWTVACQAPLSMGFSKQEYWNGLPCPPPGNLPNPGIKP